MPVTRNEKIAGGIFAGVIATAAAVGLIVADDGTTDAPPSASAQAAPSGAAFEAQFGTAADFYDNFDYGYSGANPWAWGNGSGNGAILNFHGDHNSACGGPTTDRVVGFTGNAAQLNFSQLFWWCAPGGDSTSGHVMSGVNTVHYNYAWFATKQFYTGVSKVCWDMNQTQMSSRKWMAVVFADQADATRYPVGPFTDQAGGTAQARGTGGFDLGFANPDHRQNPGPTTDIIPKSGTMAGFEYNDGAIWWYQNQNTWTAQGMGPRFNAGTDKATRYKTCLTNQSNNTIRVDQETPGGPQVRNVPGQLPQHPVKVIWQDNNYNPPKGDNYNATQITWHWDNIQIFTGTPPAPTTTQAPPVTTQPSTTAPLPTATQPPTIEPTTPATTTSTTTATTSSTSTVPGSSTVPPADVVEVPRADLEALLASLEQLVAAIQALLTEV